MCQAATAPDPGKTLYKKRPSPLMARSTGVDPWLLSAALAGGPASHGWSRPRPQAVPHGHRTGYGSARWCRRCHWPHRHSARYSPASKYPTGCLPPQHPAQRCHRESDTSSSATKHTCPSCTQPTPCTWCWRRRRSASAMSPDIPEPAAPLATGGLFSASSIAFSL